MRDTTATKVDSAHSPRGALGQKYLASSVHVGMRLWENEQPGEPKPATRREYETVGYVIKGRAELRLEGQLLRLGPGGPRGRAPGAGGGRGGEQGCAAWGASAAAEGPPPPAHAHGRDN